MIKYFACTLCLILFGNNILLAQKLRIAVAANAQYVAKVLKKVYEKETGIAIELIVNSSGKLTTQIQQGAPFDVFLSADTKYPQALYKSGLTTGKPKIYAYGTLVLWTTKKLDLNKNLREVLLNSNINKLAIANPETAPYGTAAIQVLNYYKIYPAVKPKLVYGESISQVSQYVLSGAADIGFSAKSVVMEPALKGKGRWYEIDAMAYTPIAQSAVLLKSKQYQNTKQAQHFYNFLFSSKAKAIFRQYGYVPS